MLHRLKPKGWFPLLAIATVSHAAWAQLQYPGIPPGAVRVVDSDSQLLISNQAIRVVWQRGPKGLERARFEDVQGRSALTFDGDLFQILLTDGTLYSPSNLVSAAAVSVRESAPIPGSPRLAARAVGKVIEAPMRSRDGRLRVAWRAVAVDDANYLRQEVDLTSAESDCAIQSVTWLRELVPGARTLGQVDGSLVAAGNLFFGCEDPHALNRAGPARRQIGNWSPQDVDIRERRLKTWPVDRSALHAGTNRVVFWYESGPHRLDIWRVALLENGREVARDQHHGRAGGEHVDNGYVLVLPELKDGARYQLTAQIGTDPDFQFPPGERADSSGRVETESGPKEGVLCQLQRGAVLRRGETLKVSFVVGVAPTNQLRRAFLYYLERERAHPCRPYLHYNSWYDIAWHPFALNETNCLEAIRLLGERFIQPHGVVMDAVVFDDGWDDPASLWQFHRGFPNGFAPLAQLCRQYHTKLGVWLSPFGGYGEPKAKRLQFGGAQGYETNAAGFSLAGPKYYAAFKQGCVRMIREFGVNHFKFDGIATGMYANGSGQYILDTEAMRRLMLELRQEDPQLYINLTTGSWPSPFWLRYADSLWRQGGDMGHAGKGTKQQQWLTYRDQETFRNIVGKGPLFPLNSLMSQGVAYSREGMAGDPTFNSSGFRDDVRAFFGSGTSLQELYIQPGKLLPEDWRILAQAAKWSRANADVLVDTHWIGGDPGKSEVYGYASWSPRKGIVMLRNPDDQPREITFDVARIFELPPGAPTNYLLKSPWADQASLPTLQATAGGVVALDLKPFEVVVLDATPTSSVTPAGTPASALIPRPVLHRQLPGTFSFDRDTKIVVSSGDAAERRRLAGMLCRAMALPLPEANDSGTKGSIRLELKPDLAARLGREGYRLEIRPESVRIQAATEAGVFYGGISLRQMLPPVLFQPGAAWKTETWQVPCAEIEDYPRFSWRGLLVDPARHFLPIEFVKKMVDLMALHKLNTLQIHLTDDQGWRMEIKKYPRLTQVGAFRKESPRHGNASQGDGLPYGPFFYTQEQLRDLVAYAKERNVTILPEIEMPGHFLGALAAYPQFSCTGGPFEVRTRWGVHQDILCAGNEEAVRFAQDVLDEVVAVFPSPFIHIGGDEAPRDRWKACAKCQARLKAEGLKSEAQLQTWFNRRIEEFLAGKGRRMIGWDEILEGGLTPDAAVMSWRGMKGGITAAEAGHDVVMAPTTHCYLDYAQSQAPEEPEGIGGFIPLQTVYSFEPVPATLSLPNQRLILGAQGNLWGEFMWTGKDVEYFAFPRAAALSEVLWSPRESRDLANFRSRLPEHLRRLEALGVNYCHDLGMIRPSKL